jgi:hypothetical protein
MDRFLVLLPGEVMSDRRNTRLLLPRHVSPATGILASVLGAFGLFLLGLVLTGRMWRALAFATVALLGFLVVQAILFWGAVLLGSLFEVATRRRNPASWSIGGSPGLDAPEHDLDPGLQLLAAGMLVYHLGEMTPRVHFRRVPLAGARSIRPFVVARTGSPRPCRFEFVLSDEGGVKRFRDEFAFDLRDDPQIVLPCCRLALSMPRRLVGQRWSLRVRSGVTTVTSFRFTFVDAGGHPNGVAGAWAESVAGWQQELLPALLDEALKRDMLASTREIVLEDV